MERRKSLRLEVGRPGLCIPGCSDTPECKGTAGVDLARVPVAHGRCRDTLRSWQQPEERKNPVKIPHHISRPAAALGQSMDETSKIWVGRGATISRQESEARRTERSDALKRKKRSDTLKRKKRSDALKRKKRSEMKQEKRSETYRPSPLCGTGGNV